MRPAGRFCGSARQSSAPSEFPQIFHVAVELLSLSLNHAFCSAPRIVCGGALRCGLGTCASLKRISGRRIAAVEGAPAVENLHLRLRKHSDELVAAELSERRIAEGIRAPIAVLVGNDQVQVLAVAQRPVGLEAVDRRQVVRFHPQPIAIELVDGNVLYRWWIEAFEQLAARRRHVRGDIRTRPGSPRP